MRRSTTTVLAAMVALLLAAALAGCPAQGRRGDDVASMAMAPEAVAALQDSRFEEAATLAAAALARDDRNAQAHLVAAVTRYKRAMHQFVSDIGSIVAGMVSGGPNDQYLQFALDAIEGELAGVEQHLAAASRDPDVVLEQCLAAWRVDWNRSGDIDERDLLLLQVEVNAYGVEIPEDDPRRTPTFRFDRGDVFWARAMVAFQRALLRIVAAYRMPDLHELARSSDAADPAERVLRLRLRDPAFVHAARDLVLAGVDHADRAREEYLAETDDDREWLPNPSQKQHPLPLPVDKPLYDTWKGVLGDVRALVAGEEGIDVGEAARLGDHRWDEEEPPRGFIDVGRLLSEPRDIVLSFDAIERFDNHHSRASAETVLRELFGDKYRQDMRPSRLLSRLARMKDEVECGEESLERKLRYLLWLN